MYVKFMPSGLPRRGMGFSGGDLPLIPSPLGQMTKSQYEAMSPQGEVFP